MSPLSLKANRSIASIQRVDPSQFSNWNALLTERPDYSFFHSTAWANVVSATYDYAPVYFIESDGNVPRSILPLMEVDSWLTGRRGIGLPFTDDCEPLYTDLDSGKRLVREALDFGKSRDWKYLECRGGRELFDGATASLSFYGHSLGLEKSDGQIFAGFESSVRRAIRKAEKSGVTVTVSQSLESVREFYSLQCKTRRKHGLPPQPFPFFKNIHEHVIALDMGIVVVAHYRGRPIAASVYFHLGRHAIYKYGASDEVFQHLRGTNLVMWEAIKWHAHNGMKTLHLGRTSITNHGLRQFKLGWGADERVMEYFKYDLRNERFVTDADEVSGWHNRLFKVMPGFISRLIGRTLYRHWA